MDLTFQVLATRKVKRKGAPSCTKATRGGIKKSWRKPFPSSTQVDESSEPPRKSVKLDLHHVETTPFTSPGEDPTPVLHHRPPTPPETPEAQGDHLSSPQVHETNGLEVQEEDKDANELNQSCDAMEDLEVYQKDIRK